MPVSSPEPIKQFVRAGAGAGKTWNLTREVVKQALDHYQATGQWPKTVLTTFTRKATQELKERLLIYCIKERPEALEFVQSSFLNITTMHGLLSLFLSRYGYAMGLPNQFRIVDGSQADRWRKLILKNMISSGEIPASLQVFEIRRLLKNLKEYENVYWDSSAKPVTVADLESLHGHYSQDLASRLTELAIQGKDVTDGEKWDLYWQQLSQIRSVLKKQKLWQEIRISLEPLLVDLKKPRKSKNNPGLPEDIDSSLKELLAEIKDLVTDPQFSCQYWDSSVQTFADFQVFANSFMKKLRDKKIIEASVEPNDLENYSLHLILSRPDLVEKFSQDHEAWFIDEFQDTSPLQMKILEPMIAGRSCYIVGDPQQSIYLFRGSRSEVFLDKQQQMQEQKAEMRFLQKNYRSQENLLTFINDFFPRVDNSFSVMDPVIEASSEVATCVTHFNDEDFVEELNEMSGQISKLLKQGASPKDFCILTRTHGDLERVQKKLMTLGFPVISHSSAQFYRRREVLDAFSLLKLLLNPWDDKNLILFMRSPWVGLSDNDIYQIIKDHKNQYWKVFKEYFENNDNFYAGQKILEAFQNKSTFGMGWVFRKTLLNLGLIDYCAKIDSTGRREANLWKIVNLVEKTSRESGGSLLQLVREGFKTSSLEDFSEGTDASSPVEPNKINLMTIHASKGLQFKYVFMPFLHKKPRDTTFTDFCADSQRGLWSFRLPLIDPSHFSGGILEKLYVSDMKRREKEESLRLLYVGMTRAEQRLFLSWTGKPKKNSWALLVESYTPSISNSFVYEFKQKDQSEEQAYEAEATTKNVRQSFDNSLDRFEICPQGFVREEKDQFENWIEVEQKQSKRWEGVVLHKLFENLKDHSVETVLKKAQTWLPGKESSVKEALNFVLDCQQVPLKEMIAKGHVEWGYQKMEGEILKERQIDLWGIVDEVLWVADYKTGSTHFKDKAMEQMNEYQKDLVEHLQWKGAVKLAAVFPFSQKIFIKAQ